MHLQWRHDYLEEKFNPHDGKTYKYERLFFVKIMNVIFISIVTNLLAMVNGLCLLTLCKLALLTNARRIHCKKTIRATLLEVNIA